MTPLTAEPKPFNLVRSFAVLSLLTIGVTTLVTAGLLSRFLVDRQLQRDADYTMQFLQSVLQTGDQDQYFSQVQEPGAGGSWGGFFSRIIDFPDVFRANVFSRSGTVVWSSEKALIGRHFETNHELDGALSGEVVSHLEKGGHEAKDEHVNFPHGVEAFVESYVPIWSQDRSQVIGVVEVYRAPRRLFRELNQARLLVAVNALFGGALLYGILFWIVRRADGLLRLQQERLVEFETVAVIGEMAAAVAHGIRNPLASIRATAQNSLREGDSGLQPEDARDIIDETDRVEVWIRDLLHLSKPQNGEMTAIQLDDVVLDCLKGFRGPMERQQVADRVQVRGRIPAIHGDPLLLEQMFNSLIANALEAMPRGGELSVGIDATDSLSVEVEIADTGHGIPRDRVDQVFKPFYTSKPSGIGIGLMLGKRIAERHGAHIRLASLEGSGTTVCLTFPAG